MIDIIAWFIITWMIFLVLADSRRGRAWLQGIADTRLSRTFFTAILASLVLVGWTKGPVVNPSSRHISQFVLALMSGGVRDDSGVVAEQTQLNTISAFVDLAEEMLHTASNELAKTSQRFDALQDQLTNNAQPVVYIQSFFPREDPYVALTNHNLAVLALQQSTSSNVLSRWIYFSDDLVNEPTLYAEADVGGGYVRLTEITNTYPNTELVDGIECVRYDYDLPDGMQGVVFSPDFDLRFGSAANGLQIGAGGLEMIDTNGVSHIGSDGWSTMCSGRVEVLHAGGVAVKIKIDGNEITNGVYTL